MCAPCVIGAQMRQWETFQNVTILNAAHILQLQAENNNYHSKLFHFFLFNHQNLRVEHSGSPVDLRVSNQFKLGNTVKKPSLYDKLHLPYLHLCKQIKRPSQHWPTSISLINQTTFQAKQDSWINYFYLYNKSARLESCYNVSIYHNI